ncbi:ABC transporter permease [Marinitenerispora sediminis]|uniref:Peptide ABC transporter permease n=1 Tax=Marinitenerispora sediminis TaxID=1931232 RepID=A0A368T589_9ACTN|nr:ABC transporter permease [Marinitenerispora sediminis]RCV50066.1 peptide ABC transporter permease [Marinitenerispora sediminis]RCV54002.1 peptide ABC transporter permease [Marinitenerispora sediminis]RCV58775.1 peptide ABC transporter permease [Marinitenerispora sediminis]
MPRFLLGRLLSHVLLLVASASCCYLLAASALDPRGNYEGQRPPPPEHVVDAVLAEYNLDNRVPLAERYATWAGGVLRGDFGRTWDGQSVNDEMARRIGVSVRLLTLGTLAGTAAGVLLGAWAGARRRGAVDRMATAGAVVVVSVPTVVIAVCLQTGAVWLNQAAGVDLLRTTGEFTPGLTSGFWDGLLNRAQHLVLPTVALALPFTAVLSRYQRGLMADEAEAEYVRTARAKGLPRRTALLRHALRTALVPAVTYSGHSAAALLTGAVFTETVFGWHGVGELLMASVARGDVNAVAAVCAFGALCVITASLVSDVARFLLDPRVRVG